MFLQYREQISLLKAQDAHFARLYAHHHEMDQRIRYVEAGIIARDGMPIEHLKAEQRELRNLLFARLRNTSDAPGRADFTGSSAAGAP